ncbi:hypothetical protein JZ751_015028 [Albula glossodonta]|uniref:Group XIIA secretory phospholipase A2 n=1 Tax=Albula glossodonta TaxID=121402 RepID=A0A8T2MVG7_9TELE|nr:hypothetical protein JZ751_015028 [Albula glossodonta]
MQRLTYLEGKMDYVITNAATVINQCLVVVTNHLHPMGVDLQCLDFKYNHFSQSFTSHLQFDIGIPSMTKCCNQHDRCYDTCGSDKHDCDEQFQFCLETICRNVQRTLGLSHSVQACETAVNLLFDAVMHLGCKPYLDSQRASCMCLYEDKQEL